MEDRLLLLRFRLGSVEALQRIYQKYFKEMYTLAATLVRDKSSAEDIVQEVFASLVQSVQSIGNISNLKAYLMTSAVNRARNMMLSRIRQPASLGNNDPAVACEDVVSELVKDEQMQQLAHALGQLPYEQEETILLYLRSGLTFKAIAVSQQVSLNTVQSRYRYGMEKLRSIMKSEVQKCNQ